MRDRLTAALIFALFGALVTVVVALAIDGIVAGGEDIELNLAAMPYVTVLAAFSAGLSAACVGRTLISRPVPFGMLTMLAAQLPFSLLVVAFGSIDPPASSLDDLASFFVALLIGGWLVAGIFQITAGAIAGLLLKHVLKRKMPSAAPTSLL